MRPIRRIVDCGPAAVNDAGPNGGALPEHRNYQDYQYVDSRYGQTSSIIASTETTWVRFWAEWSVFQPFSDVVLGQSYPEGNPTFNSPEWKRLRAWRALQALDRQINAARADGRRVLLTLFRCPPWANGTEWYAQQRDNPVNNHTTVWHDIDYMPQDRLKRPDYDAWKDSQPAGTTDKSLRTHSLVAHRRELEYKWPDDIDSDSPWARWFQFLYDRYRPGRLGHARCVNVMEVINEPNGQMWPKMAQDPNDVWAPEDPNYGCAVAALMQTAAFISSWYSYELTIAAPATSDEPNDRGYPRMWTPYDQFQNQVLASCAQNGFAPHTKFVWTHHNYKDVEEGRTYTSNNMSYLSRRALRGKWTGYAEGAGPMLFITEGGYPLTKASGTYEQQENSQSGKVAQFASLMNSTDPVAGNIGMISNYLVYSTPYSSTSGSSGLRWFPGPSYPDNGRARPAQDSWRLCTPVDSALSDWQWWANLGGNSGYDLAAISLWPGHREVFMIDAYDGRLRHKWDGGGGFVADWYDLGGYCTSPAAAYSRPGSGRTDIAVRGWDLGIYLKYMENGWSQDWEYIGMPNGGSAGGAAIMSTQAGARGVFVRGADNNVWEKWHPPGGGWSGWNSHGAPPGGAASDPAICSWGFGRQDLFVLGSDGACWWRYGWNGWSGWSSLGGNCQSSPEVCSPKPGRLEVYVRGPNWAPYRRVFEGLTDGGGGLIEGRWGPWERIVVAQGTEATTGMLSSPAVCAQGGRVDLFARFGNNQIHHNWWGH